MRLTKEQLSNIMIQNKVNDVYSWSRIQSYHTDPYSYFLKYIQKISPDRGDSSYTFLGSAAHALLEDFYDDKITNDEMIEQFKEKVLVQELSGIKFSSNDEQNDSIKENYITALNHFFKEYKKDNNASLEQYVYGFIDKYFFGGYVDKMHKEEDNLIIEDFKTSTIYSKSKIENDKGQLFIYAMLMNQMYNIPYSQIRVRWNFLKYVKLTYTQINGKKSISYIKRNELAQTLKAKITTWLAHEKYSESDIDDLIIKVNDLNINENLDRGCISVLPDNVRDKFLIEDGLLEVEINDEEIENFKNKISEMCGEIESKSELYKITKDENMFWSEVNSSNSYYFANLCNYSSKYHKPYKEYLDNLESLKTEKPLNEENDLMKLLFT